MDFTTLHETIIPKSSFILDTFIQNKFMSIKYLDTIIINYKHTAKLITITAENCIGYHLLRLIAGKNNFDMINDELKMNNDDYGKFLISLAEFLEKPYLDNCTICGKQLNIIGLNTISHCENSICQRKFYHVVTDNNSVTKYKTDIHLLLFLTYILVSGTYHPNGELGYKPLPYIFNVSNFTELQKLITNEIAIINNLEAILPTIIDDFDLIKKTNHNVYAIIKNAVSNNYFLMNSVYNLPILNELNVVNISYTADIENKFEGNHFLFHGSPIHSWYSIIKNGLKNMSHSALQAHGAAYGSGVYFSDNLATSLAYAKGNGAIGVFEILNDPAPYKKAPNIYVINNEQILLLRCIINVSNSQKQSSQTKNTNGINLSDISDFFLNMYPQIIKQRKFKIKSITNKRLNNELKLLHKNTKINNIVVVQESKWKISYKPINTKIYEIEIIFSDYPVLPPVINLLNYKIEKLCDSKNNILLPILNPTEWGPVTKITEIIDTIYNCILNEN